MLLTLGCHGARAVSPAHAEEQVEQVSPSTGMPPFEPATYEVTTYVRATEGSDLPTTGALLRIRAPVADVLAEALRFKRYWELISPYLESSNIVGKFPSVGVISGVRRLGS